MTARAHKEWLEGTPAGWVHSRLGISETRDPDAAAEFVEHESRQYEAAYGRTPYPEELGPLRFAAEQRTARVHTARKPPESSYDIAKLLGWGVTDPPRKPLVAPDWMALPGRQP